MAPKRQLGSQNPAPRAKEISLKMKDLSKLKVKISGLSPNFFSNGNTIELTINQFDGKPKVIVNLAPSNIQGLATHVVSLPIEQFFSASNFLGSVNRGGLSETTKEKKKLADKQRLFLIALAYNAKGEETPRSIERAVKFSTFYVKNYLLSQHIAREKIDDTDANRYQLRAAKRWMLRCLYAAGPKIWDCLTDEKEYPSVEKAVAGTLPLWLRKRVENTEFHKETIALTKVIPPLADFVFGASIGAGISLSPKDLEASTATQEFVNAAFHHIGGIQELSESLLKALPPDGGAPPYIMTDGGKFIPNRENKFARKLADRELNLLPAKFRDFSKQKALGQTGSADTGFRMLGILDMYEHLCSGFIPRTITADAITSALNKSASATLALDPDYINKARKATALAAQKATLRNDTLLGLSTLAYAIVGRVEHDVVYSIGTGWGRPGTAKVTKIEDLCMAFFHVKIAAVTTKVKELVDPGDPQDGLHALAKLNPMGPIGLSEDLELQLQKHFEKKQASVKEDIATPAVKMALHSEFPLHQHKAVRNDALGVFQSGSAQMTVNQNQVWPAIVRMYASTALGTSVYNAFRIEEGSDSDSDFEECR